MSLKDKVIFISGGSRGIGLAMAKRAAQDGAKIVVAAKTAEPHPKLPGTILLLQKRLLKLAEMPYQWCVIFVMRIMFVMQ